MESQPLEDFNEVEWNKVRLDLEEEVIHAVNELSNYMGCNQFSLTEGAYIINVRVDCALLD